MYVSIICVGLKSCELTVALEKSSLCGFALGKELACETRFLQLLGWLSPSQQTESHVHVLFLSVAAPELCKMRDASLSVIVENHPAGLTIQS